MRCPELGTTYRGSTLLLSKEREGERTRVKPKHISGFTEVTQLAPWELRSRYGTIHHSIQKELEVSRVSLGSNKGQH